MNKVLNQSFFARQSPMVAKDLLGKFVVRRVDGQDLIGKVVETESYLPFDDPASHAFIGKTLRNAVLFGEAGYSYVYSIHRYFCLNVVCDDLNVPGCVLIRALEPTEGMKFMQEYRMSNNSKNITNGPGRLCQAMQINRNQNGINLADESSELKICEGDSISEDQIVTTPRIGISKAIDLPLRFYIKDSKFRSK